MSKLRWIKFWFVDWTDDPGLRACSLEARGLWMELLSIASKADPVGHILINGHVPTDSEVAKVVGANTLKVRKLLAELDRHGVCSTTPDGVRFSRRMAGVAAKLVASYRDGLSGGNPALKHAKSKPNGDARVNPHVNPNFSTLESSESGIQEALDEGVRTPSTPKKEPSKPPAAREASVVSFMARKGSEDDGA